MNTNPVTKDPDLTGSALVFPDLDGEVDVNGYDIHPNICASNGDNCNGTGNFYCANAPAIICASSAPGAGW